ncbi:helix-turn-helix domain-containing protein [Enterobacter oligotrophicus]|uniref:helix-turn-helix domain-containing protein n=1 Tax=Enterobacter oligotrophicus TaxID=2478464 RepID=UPI001260B843|nr:helix-turn-helix domain-containing protein [Enterobacter oligotrophicus]
MSKNEALIGELINWIEEHIDQAPAVEDVCKRSGYTPRHIQKLFSDVTGKTVGDYIRKRRLTRAAILVTFTKKSIYHIAMELNFSTQQTFSRAFRREFGCSPLQYRSRKYLQCSRLTPRFSSTTQSVQLFLSEPKGFRLRVFEFKYREALLDSAKRGSQLRLDKVMNILAEHSVAVVVSNIACNSKRSWEVEIQAKSGFHDNKNYNYERVKQKYWTTSFKGTWEEYIAFIRNFLISIDLNLYQGNIIEEIRLCEQHDNENINFNFILYFPVTL